MKRTTMLGLLGVALLAVPARAQSNGASAQAEILFRQGKELMAANKTAEACEAFDASQKLEPTISTRMNQANCREKNGQLATAWGLFLDAARQTRAAKTDADRQLNKVATERAAKLEGRLSTIRFDVPAEHRVAGLEILRDAEVVEAARWNTKLPVDGGTFKITVRAPGFQSWTGSVVVAVEKDAKTVDVPRLVAAPPAGDPPPRVTPVPEPSTTASPTGPAPAPVVTGPVSPGEPARSSLTGRRKLALGVASGGVLALGIGAVLGVSAKGKQSDADSLCPDPETPCADAARATELTAQGHDRAVQANIAFAVGGVAIVGAAVLWFTGKPAEARGVSIVPRVTPGETGIAVLGRF